MCFFWNRQGAASNDFLYVLFELLRLHKPVILVLVETKVHSLSASVILQKSHLNKVVAIEAIGFSGGIWVFWGDAFLDLEVLSVCDQIVTMAVKRKSCSVGFLGNLCFSKTGFL